MQESADAVERAVLTGPAVAIPGFAARLSEQLHLPVESAVVAVEGEGSDSSRLTVAAGLALDDTP
jgi:Tfp pilus assembly PilM family ATPase